MFSFPFVSITVRFLSFRALSLHDYSFFVETLIIRFRIPGQSFFEIDILVWYETKIFLSKDSLHLLKLRPD